MRPATNFPACYVACTCSQYEFTLEHAVGVGEGVVLPSMNSLVAKHIPPAAKARALGLIFTGFHTGNLVGLTLSPAIITAYGWHALFSVVSLLGLPLLLLWRVVQPSDSQVAAASSTLQSTKAPVQAQVPISKLLSCSAVQAIIVANFVNHWGYFIFLSWIPAYFSSVYGLNMKASSFMAFVPWIAMAVGSSFAGVLADRLVELYPVCDPFTEFSGCCLQVCCFRCDSCLNTIGLRVP